MTKKKKIIIGVGVIILLSFLSRRIIFTVECLIAKQELKENFFNNKDLFSELSNIPKGQIPYNFYMFGKDSISINFRDSSRNYDRFFPADSSFYFTDTSDVEFRVNKSYCLEIINDDTIKICDATWFVGYYGHYKSTKIDPLLDYYKIKRKDFNSLVDIVQKTNCMSLTARKSYFNLDYKFVSYYGSGIINCFGHSDGFFNYVQSDNSDSLYFKDLLTKYDNSIYGYSYWSFIW